MEPQLLLYAEIRVGDVLQAGQRRCLVIHDTTTIGTVEIIFEHGTRTYLCECLSPGIDLATAMLAKIGSVPEDVVHDELFRMADRYRDARQAIHAEAFRNLVDGPGPTEKPIVPEERTRSICLEPLA